MKEVTKTKINYATISIIFILIVLSGYLLINRISMENDNKVYKAILVTEQSTALVSINEQKAESYYQEASYAYAIEDYIGVQSYCRLARGEYSTASQEYKDANAKLLSYNLKDNLIDLYSQSILLNSEIDLNLYEALHCCVKGT